MTPEERLKKIEKIIGPSVKTGSFMITETETNEIYTLAGSSQESTPPQWSFFTLSDKLDLIKHVEKFVLADTFSLTDGHAFLDIIEKKASKIHKEILESMVTVSFIGSFGSGKSVLLQKMLQVPIPGFKIVEINRQSHYIRYAKIKR